MPSIFAEQPDNPAASVLTPNTPLLLPKKQELAVTAPLEQRDFTDSAAARKNIYSRVLGAFGKIGPLANTRHTLELSDVHYSDPEEIELRKQKEAILAGKSLYRRVKGTWRLTDNATGNVLDEKVQTVAQVPYLTQRGTFVLNGTEYTLSNQMRLRPGIFTRIKENGEIESHVNVIPGGGISHRYFLDPETGIFKINIGQAKLPLYPVLSAMGVTDTELRKTWGPELLAINMRSGDSKTIDKLYSRLIRKPDKNADARTKSEAVANLMLSMKLDPEVTSRTLGQPFDALTKDAILATTKKLISVSRMETDPDDRDHLAFQTFHGPEDLLSERITKDRAFLRQLLWKASFRGNLKPITPGILTRQLHNTILHTGLGQAAEEINPAELLDAQMRTTRLGEGGIASLDAVPEESRSVSPSQLAFVDLIKTPESSRAGIDTRLAWSIKKGNDGRIYAPMIDVKTGKTVFRTPQDLADEVIAFPGELSQNKPFVYAMDKGHAAPVPRESVRYEMPHMENAFSPLSNMIPSKSSLKGQRLSMGARFLAQALPLTQREAPLVQSGMPGMHMVKSFEEHYGSHLGAVRAKGAGTVKKITKDAILVQNDDGSKETYELYDAFPYARKTFSYNTPLVTLGQRINKDQLLAKSNYTDDAGTTALGLNARIAFIPFRGANYEDALVISDSFAKKLTSEHLYQNEQQWSDNIRKGLKPFIGLFPTEYDKSQLANMDERGVLKTGSVVKYGDPIVLVAEERELGYSQIHRGRKPTYANKSILWEHHSPGTVTDVYHSPKGTTVAIKADSVMNTADKLCYSSDTELLTSVGWKSITEVTTDNEIASLRDDHTIEYLSPTEVHKYKHSGRMYAIDTTQVSLLVTDNHQLYVASGDSRRRKPFQLKKAEDLFGTFYRMKNNAGWVGNDPEFVKLDGYEVKAGKAGKVTKQIAPRWLDVKTYVTLLGMYLSEGHCINHPASGTFAIVITQIKPDGRKALFAALDALKVKYSTKDHGVVIYSKHLMQHFSKFGYSHEKFIPDEVFSWSKDTLKLLYKWLMWGDGCEKGTGHVYTTTSKRLADDVQRLCLHIGYAGKVKRTNGGKVHAFGKVVEAKPIYRVYIYRKKTEPSVNHGHVKEQHGQAERWEQYDGHVYCVTLPRNHVLYVRRNGKPVWCGNSNRFGGKGVVSAIVPDEQMPHDENGVPFEVAMNPLGMISRINPSQIAELILGKIAKKTGKPYKLEDFSTIGDLVDFVKGEMAKHGVPDTETVIDPETGRKIPNVLTGYQYLLKLHHTAESKSQGRGLGGYTSEGVPARGGAEGSKQIALLETNALLSHGATEFLRDAHLIRGQRNDPYWQAFMSGFRPAEPEVPLVYQKYVNSLKAAGINVVRDGTQLHVMALTDKDIDKLAGDRYLENAETVDWKEGLRPRRGGLFDPALTGGHNGNRFAKLRLFEPMPNPAFEEPIRRVLGLTQNKFEAVLSGKESINGHSGPKAIQEALANVDLRKAIRQAESEIAGSKKTTRDEAIRKLGYLKNAERLGLHPKDWVISNAPVLPPIFRPVAIMQGTGNQLVSDPNYLYRELFDANEALKSLHGVVDDVSTERLNLYNAFKGVVGLGDPIQPKNQERQVKGILKHVFGTSPKFSTVQRQLLGTPVELVGRSVIAPNPDLDMDHIGIPENKAWDVYKPFIIRRLVQRGVPRLEAAQAVKEKRPIARDAMVQELNERPVVISRAPVLHRYGIMGFWPKLVKGDIMQMPPLVFKPFNADSDGNCIGFNTGICLDIDRSAIYTSSGGKQFLDSLEESMLAGKVNVGCVGNKLYTTMPIGEFPRIGEPQIGKRGEEIYEVPPGVTICTYDHNTGDVKYSAISKFTVDKNHPCVRVTTARNRSVDVSDNESLCVFDTIAGGLQRIKPEEAIGKVVPCVINEGHFGEFGDKELGWWYGAFISDGWQSSRMIGYTKLEKAKRDEFIRIARAINPNFIAHEYAATPETSPGKLGPSIKVHLNGAEFSQGIMSCVARTGEGRAALYKKIPEVILYTGSRDMLLGVLSGLIDGDGSIGWNVAYGKPRVACKISTSSKRLRDDVVHLCRKLGLRTSVTTHKPRNWSNESYGIALSTIDLAKIIDELYLVGAKEKTAAAKFRETPPSDRTSIDIVPIHGTLAAALASEFLTKTTMSLYSILRRAIKCGTLGRMSAVKILNQLDDDFEHEHLAEFRAVTGNTDIAWDVIERVDRLEPQDVFDFEVCDTKVFMIDNGMIVYDTMNWHIPVSEEARKEVIEKMLPSKNLLSMADFKPLYTPQQEYQGGLYAATAFKDEKRRPSVFRNKQDVIKAYREGRLSVDSPVEIIEH